MQNAIMLNVVAPLRQLALLPKLKNPSFSLDEMPS
jgi:hypothetical protein